MADAFISAALRTAGGKRKGNLSGWHPVDLAGKLIDGRLWDGQSPIRIDDVYVTMKKMKHLSEREMSLFTLEDFVQVGGTTDATEIVEDAERDAVEVEDDGIETEPLLMTTTPSLNGKTFSANGHHLDDAADE